MLKYQFSVILFIFILLNSILFAGIINVPADQPTIQSGIDNVSDGDTVLVASGTYTENINFLGKRIVVASHYILSKNLDFINSTIIDGSNPSDPDTASCVVFYSGEDSASVLRGFTITGGTGTKWIDPGNPGWTWRGGGGVFTFSSSPTIKNNIIKENTVTNTTGVNGAQGGGTLSFAGNPRIINNLILENEAQYGAGIVLDYSGGIVKNNIIYKNFGGQAYGGGGIWTIGNGISPIIIENNHIIENSVTGTGTYGGRGGAMFVWMGTITARNNIIWGNTQSQGGPIAEIGGGSATITFSNIEGGFSGTGNIDISPDFTNSNLYLQSSSPCIDTGDSNSVYNDIEDPNNLGFSLWPSQGTVRNDMGAYGGSKSELFPLFISTNLLNLPESVVFDSLYNRYFVSNKGNGNIIQINSLGAQSFFVDYSTSIRGITIVGNTLFTAGDGGVAGFDIISGDTTFALQISGAQFLNDVTSNGLGYLYVSDTNRGRIYKININNQTYTTFVNSGISSPNGLFYDGGNNRLILCSFRANSPIQAINLSDSSVSNIVTTNISNLDGLAEDNEGNIFVSSWGSNSIYKFNENFLNSPELVSSGHSGPADIFFNKQSNILAVPNFNANSIDFIQINPTSIDKAEGNIPKYFDLKQNYPNPFNPSTTIEYAINKKTKIRLSIYDSIGREIKILVDDIKKSGSYSTVWDGTNNYDRAVSSGIYYCLLKSDVFIRARKMILLQ